MVAGRHVLAGGGLRLSRAQGGVVMGMMCERCEWQGPEFPWEADGREIHRALHGLGRVFLEWLDPIVEAVAGITGPAVKIKPLADLDGFDVDRNKATFRGEVPPGGRIVGIGLVPGAGPAGGLVSFVEQGVVGEPLTPWQRDVLRRWER